MLRTDVASGLREQFLEDGYLFPDYDRYCFANLPHSVASLLGVDTGRTLPADVFDGVGDEDEFEHVLVVLVDGLGWNQWKRDREANAWFDELTREARVTPLTSVYPSETAAAITTFHTGTLPAEHGVIGWDVWDPVSDEPFTALPFTAKSGGLPKGLSPEDLFEAAPLYPELGEAGIDSHHVVPFESTYEGTTAHTYESLETLPEKVLAAIDAAENPAYTYVYIPHVDHEAHYSGTRSAAYRDTVEEVFDTVEQALSDVEDAVAEETLLLLTADHGHVDTDPGRNIFLDEVVDVVDDLQCDAHGEPVLHAGSPRNLHLHLREDRIAPVKEAIESQLDARVFSHEDVRAQQLFGDVEPSETFQRRLGDLVVTHRELGVWWSDEGLTEVGMHGGLHPDEMLTQVAAVRLSDVV
ncbi:alkaline phosphatase family protein [Haloarchaeobius sp. TZWWS8]|uniref:alkaline phosphatase family protein n=1 Tax=Haloarchaeobius sp. TZWWS8 TaxID=3446121 RepID=UPI003EBBCDFB